MSDSTTAPQTEAPAPSKEPVPPTATDKPAPAEPAAAGKTDAEKNEDSLAKLLKHINDLQAENSELEEAMKLVRDGNLAKLKASVAEKIQPWVEKLDIPADQKEMFVQGITNAAQMGTCKTLNNFEENPIYNVVCSAAAAHGAAIQELEDTRKKLAEVENSRQSDLVDQEKKMNERANAMLYSSSAREGASRKRMHEEVSQDDASKDTGGIWDAMFNSMRQQNGRF